MNFLTYDKVLRRLWICDLRIHHGLVGLCLIGLGIGLTLHDWKDRPWVYDR